METGRLAAPAVARSPVRRVRLSAPRPVMSVPVIESMKNNWRELTRGTPGKRFQERYEKKRRSGQSGVARTLKLTAAILLIAAGIVLLVIPGPGSVLIVLGAALL